MVMQFRTEVQVPPFDWKISYEDALFLMGSCFVENIGRQLQEFKFRAEVNPFGVLFNPESIRLALLRMMEDREFDSSDLFEQDGVWNSFSLHSSFASLSASDFLEKANSALRRASSSLAKADVLFVTWGTAWVYRLNGEVVANCHKQPSSLFSREQLSVESIVASYSDLLSKLCERNERLKMVLTVSPIRHWKDGAHGNQLSKSVLLLAADVLVRRFPDKVFYFPSYEIMMDDLRDYRFYASDLLHPGEQAIQYLWERFSECFFSEKAHGLMGEVERVVRAASHRPFNPNSLPHRKFMEQTLAKVALLESEYPFLDLSAERKALSGD